MADEIYKLANVPIFEAIYGKGFISLGGSLAVEKMFAGLDLKNKNVLDIGFGIGGLPHLLASKFGAKVLGLEVHQWMARYAKEEANESIRDQLQFKSYESDGSFPVEATSIDLVCSKGVLTNIKNKEKLFSEVYRVLKPKAQILLIDWLVPESVGPQSTTLHMGDDSHKEAQSTYLKILNSCGFVNLQFENVSGEYLEYVKNLNVKLNSEEHKINYKNIIANDLRDELIESNLKLLHSIEAGEQLSFKITAAK